MSHQQNWRNSLLPFDPAAAIRQVLNAEYHSRGFFSVRIPLLSLNAILFASNFGKLPERRNGITKEQFEAELAARLEVALKLLHCPWVQEAIYLASPTLWQRFTDSLRESSSNLEPKLRNALFRYLTRMSSRCTPFGLFASISVGRIAEESNFEHSGTENLYRHSEISAEVLEECANQLLDETKDLKSLLIYTNNSLFTTGEIGKYIEVVRKNNTRSHQLIAYQRTPFIDCCVSAARDGIQYIDLQTKLKHLEADLQDKEIQLFLNDLIDAQILVVELYSNVTEISPAENLQTKMKGSDSSLLTRLSSCIKRAMQSLPRNDQLGKAVPVDVYRNVRSILKPVMPNALLRNPYRVDSFCDNNKLALSQKIAGVIGRGAIIYSCFSQRKRDDRIERFATEFAKRYDTNWVPLCEALDDEAGIMFGQPGSDKNDLLEGVSISNRSKVEHIMADALDVLMLEKLERYDYCAMSPIQLVPKDLSRIVPDTSIDLPDFCTALVEIRNQAEGRSDVYLKALIAPSGAQIFGRFCNGSKRLKSEVQRMVDEEVASNTDVIFAEVVHAPQALAENVTNRPAFLKYEIPYLATSTCDPSARILVSDLLITVRNNEIVFFSRSLKKRVIPRNTTMHFNGGNNLGVYQLLSAVSLHSLAGFRWSAVFKYRRYLPQIRFDDITLCLARWFIAAEDVQNVLKALKGSEYAAFVAVQRIRTEYRLPTLVSVNRSDQVLIVNLDCPLGVLNLVSMLEIKKGIYLYEVFSSPEQSVIKGLENSYASEFAVPLRLASSNRSKRYETSFLTQAIDGCRTPESIFFPGSKWAFVKIYCSAKGADLILRNLLPEVLADLRYVDQSVKYFFVRYSDPGFHLRIRFFCEAEGFWTKYIPFVLKKVAAQAPRFSVSRVQMDTYEREVSRYGGRDGILLAESFFECDSVATVSALHECGDDSRLRWNYALMSINNIARTFLGEDVERLLAFFENLFSAFASEFRQSGGLREQLAKLYRRHEDIVCGVLRYPHSESTTWYRYQKIVDERDRRFDVTENREFVHTFDDLAVASFVHMNLNRVCLSNARTQELILYYFLVRYYDSMVARTRSAKHSEQSRHV